MPIEEILSGKKIGLLLQTKPGKKKIFHIVELLAKKRSQFVHQGWIGLNGQLDAHKENVESLFKGLLIKADQNVFLETFSFRGILN